MTTSKLQNRDEFVRWYEEGKAYAWIVERYREKYGIEIGTGTISNWRHQLGLETRQVRDVELIPWAVMPEHRHAWAAQMLRAEARLRHGAKLSKNVLHSLTAWKAGLAEQDTVVHYEPDTEQGWFLVARRRGIDKDLIREPALRTRERGSRA